MGCLCCLTGNTEVAVGLVCVLLSEVGRTEACVQPTLLSGGCLYTEVAEAELYSQLLEECGISSRLTLTRVDYGKGSVG